MNKVITINLHGNAYQLEEGGYDLLRAYLDHAARRLEGNPDRDEIIADIEQAIADKCRAVLNGFKNVVTAREVQQIIDEMGPVEDATAESDDRGAAAPNAAGTPAGAAAADHPEAKSGPSVRRLYRIPEGAMIGGVCNGLAAYFGVDVTLIRIAFALLTMVWGTGIFVYFLLMIIVPTAGTSAEKAAAYGIPSTAQEFIRRAREGYYEGMRTFADKRAHREWRRRFRQEMRGWRRSFAHEMRTHAYSWTPPWSTPGWCAPTPPAPGAWFALPFVTLLRGLLLLGWVLALISLLATGALFGLVLPAGLPVWGAILLLFFAYGLVAWPLKAMRRAYYYSAAGAPPFLWAVEGLVGVAFFFVTVWLVTHHLPEIRDALHAIPSTVHQAADAIRDWWHGK